MVEVDNLVLNEILFELKSLKKEIKEIKEEFKEENLKDFVENLNSSGELATKEEALKISLRI